MIVIKGDRGTDQARITADLQLLKTRPGLGLFPAPGIFLVGGAIATASRRSDAGKTVRAERMVRSSLRLVCGLLL